MSSLTPIEEILSVVKVCHLWLEATMSESGPHYRYALEHFTREGRPLGQARVTPDFGPAREWAYFEAVRRGSLPLVTAPAGGAVVPIWSGELGPPHVSGVRVL